MPRYLEHVAHFPPWILLTNSSNCRRRDFLCPQRQKCLVPLPCGRCDRGSSTGSFRRSRNGKPRRTDHVQRRRMVHPSPSPPRVPRPWPGRLPRSSCAHQARQRLHSLRLQVQVSHSGQGEARAGEVAQHVWIRQRCFDAYHPSA